MLSLTQFIIVMYDVYTCKHKCVGVGICWRLSQWSISSISKKISMKCFKPACRVGISCHNYLETSTRGFVAEICCVMQFFLLKQSRGQFGGDSPCPPFSLVSFIIVWLSKPVILTHRRKKQISIQLWSYLFLSCLQNTYEHTRKSGVKQSIHRWHFT